MWRCTGQVRQFEDLKYHTPYTTLVLSSTVMEYYSTTLHSCHSLVTSAFYKPNSTFPNKYILVSTLTLQLSFTIADRGRIQTADLLAAEAIDIRETQSVDERLGHASSHDAKSSTHGRLSSPCVVAEIHRHVLHNHVQLPDRLSDDNNN